MSETENDGIERGPDGGIISDESAALAEAEAYPDRADPEFWDAFSERLVELCEEAGMDANFENLVECMRLHWKDLIREERTKRKAKRRRLRKLKEARQSRIDSQQAMDDEIAQLESEVGNGG